MKGIVRLAFIPALFVLTSCGGGIDSKPCSGYCEQMDELSAFGDYVCLVEILRDANRLCASRPIADPDDFDPRPTQETWDSPYCFREGEIPDDFNKPAGLNWYAIHNAANLKDCVAQCEADTHGGAIPSAMAEELEDALNKYDFFQAQLNQQCRVEATEQ